MWADSGLPKRAPASVPTPTPRRSRWRRVFGLPATRLGWWSLVLEAVSWLFIGVFAALVEAGQRGGDTFFSNPSLTSTILAAGVSGVAAGVVSALAIILRRERSLLVFLTLLLGLFVLVFRLGELVGHD